MLFPVGHSTSFHVRSMKLLSGLGLLKHSHLIVKPPEKIKEMVPMVMLYLLISVFYHHNYEYDPMVAVQWRSVRLVKAENPDLGVWGSIPMAHVTCGSLWSSFEFTLPLATQQ